MANPATYRIFLSSVSAELASYREEVARVLRRKGIEVREEKHFRQGGATLLETLHAYIVECDAVICLIGHQCGALPTPEHLAAMQRNEWVERFCEASCKKLLSYTQWEYLIAKSLNKPTYVFYGDGDFVADNVRTESDQQQALQAAFRGFVEQSGQHREALGDVSQLIEDVLVLPFPDLLQAKPSNLPQPSLGSLFKGREQFLQDLHAQLNRGGQSATAITDTPQRAQAMHGAGGIGKTRAAIEYAWRYATHYSALLFVSAQSAEALHSSLVGLSDVLPLTGLEAAPDEQRVAAVLNWLQCHAGWLLILDNVDTEPAASAVKAHLPQLTQGHLLITSRISMWSATIQTLDLGVLDLSDATEYLLEATDANRTRCDRDDELASQVASKTGRLALGLEHAAAWVNARLLGFADYLKQWQQDEARILEAFDLELIEYPHELLVTWKLSVDQLDTEAQQLLEILSWLSPEPIPDAFFSVQPDEIAFDARRCMAQLVKYSLANRVQQDQQSGFQLHRLVQASTRYHQSKAAKSDLLPLELALAWSNTAFQGDPADVRNWPTLEPLAEHVESVCQFAFDHQKVGASYPTSRLLNQLGRLFHHKARYVAAEPLLRRALAIDEASFGEHHPDVARDLNNLAALLQATNRLVEAEPLMRRALAIDEASFGEQHPRVAIDLNNLAALLQATNRLLDAEPLMRRALVIDEASFGEQHPDVAIDLNNLAQLLKATNRLLDAEPLMRRMVEIFHRFGQETGHAHPHMEAAINNYAALLVESGLSEEQVIERVQPYISALNRE